MIGDIITVKGVECVILDEINGNPFVIALDLDIESPFGNSNNYKKSELRKRVESWFKDTGIKAIARDVDLTAMDGYKGYGELNTIVAPLTFDEYRKYNHILTPHIKNWFWLITPWGSPEKDSWDSSYVCRVSSGGSAGYSGYYGSNGLAPAFILDRNQCFNKSLGDYTNEELITELNKRLKV
jgi:hypothetical protein